MSSFNGHREGCAGLGHRDINISASRGSGGSERFRTVEAPISVQPSRQRTPSPSAAGLETPVQNGTDASFVQLDLEDASILPNETKEMDVTLLQSAPVAADNLHNGTNAAIDFETLVEEHVVLGSISLNYSL